MPRIALVLLMLHIFVVPLHAAEKVEGYVYLRIFDAVTVLPSECIFDVSTVAHGASFVCAGGRVVVGNHAELGPDFLQYVRESAIGSLDKCGVSMVTFGKDGTHQVLVYNENDFLISSAPPEVLELFMEVLCSSQNTAG